MAELDKRLRQAERSAMRLDKLKPNWCAGPALTLPAGGEKREGCRPGGATSPKDIPHEGSAAFPSGSSFDDPWKVDIRVGRIVEAAPFPAARKPSLPAPHRLRAGDRRPEVVGADHQALWRDELPGRQVPAVVIFRRARSAR